MFSAAIGAVAVLVALICGRREGYRRGRYDARAHGEIQAKKQEDTRDEVENDIGAAGARDARDGLLKDWSK